MRNRFDAAIRRLVVLLGAGLASLGVASAAATEGHGFLNLVNLVPGSASCKMRISGKDAMPGGLRPSRATGWFIVPAGAHTLDLEIEGYAAASGSLEVPVGKSALCVVFLQPVRGLGKDGKPPRPRVRFARCDALPPGNGHVLRMMSLCPEESAFDVGGNPVTIKLLETVDLPGWRGGAMKVSRNRNVIGDFPTEHEKGSFYLFVGTDHEENYCSALVRAETQTLPPWMKHKTP